LIKKSNAGRIIIPDFKLSYRGIAIKTAWYWHKNRYENQWNRIEDLDMHPCSHLDLIFDKTPKTYDAEKTASSTNVAGKTGYICMQKTESRSISFILYKCQLKVD
jgi:hypothetical protein